MMCDVYSQEFKLDLNLILYLFLLKATLNSLTSACVRNPFTTAASHTPSVALSSTCEYLLWLKYYISTLQEIFRNV